MKRDKQVLDIGGDPIRSLRFGWWQRVHRTPKGWALSTGIADAGVEAEGGEPVMIIDTWATSPCDDNPLGTNYIVASPTHGLLLVSPMGLSPPRRNK
jgi:hypothetical protein